MASHGKKRHQKRLARPKAMPISAKKHHYLKKTTPGPHNKEFSIPIGAVLVEMLNVARNAREARSLIRAGGSVLVDGRKVGSLGFPVGIMDVITLPKNRTSFIVLISKGRLTVSDIPEDFAKSKLCRIRGKRQLGKSSFQVNLHDGRNVTIDDAKKYATGGTLKISIPAQAVEEYLPLQIGARCFVYKGVHSGQVAVLSQLMEREASAATDALLKGEDGKEFITRKDYLFVVGSDFAPKALAK